MKYLLALGWILATALLGYVPKQSDFLLIFSLYTALFGMYLVTYRLYRSLGDVLFFVLLAIALRGVLLFAFPNLSDDVYRFLWDGHLTIRGVSPYLYLPSEWLNQPGGEEGIFKLLYPQLNSPHYYSVYPPVCQGIFALAARVSPDHILWAAVVLKLIFIVTEATTIYLIFKLLQLMGLPTFRVLLYALNPLVIIELCGNLHFEAIMIFFITLSIWFYFRQRSKLFSISMAMAIGTKLIPVIFLPFFFRRFRPAKWLSAAMTMLVVLIALFWPVLEYELMANFGQSLKLYVRTFEFNASTYYLLRWIGFQLYGYNVIASTGPLLSLMFGASVLWLAWKEPGAGRQQLFKSLLLVMTLYLLLATTVHPWYLATLVMLSLFTHFRYPIFWGGLATLTYINYWGGVYKENLWVVAFEYSVLVVIILIEYQRLQVAYLIYERLVRLWRWVIQKTP